MNPGLRFLLALIIVWYPSCFSPLSNCVDPPHCPKPCLACLIPLCISTSVCALRICQNVDDFLCRVTCTPDYWNSVNDTLCLDFLLLRAPSGFVCHSDFPLWLLICLFRLRFLPAPWYLCHSDFCLPAFWPFFCLLIVSFESLITWLPDSFWIKTTFSAFSLVCVWFLART